MHVLLVGGDTRLLDQIEAQLNKQQRFVQVRKLVALNHAIEQTQITAFDLVINTLQIPSKDSVRLSELFRNARVNATVPTISFDDREEFEQSMHTASSSELNYFVAGVEELAYLAGEILHPDKCRIAA